MKSKLPNIGLCSELKPKVVHIITDGQIGGAQRSIEWLSKVFDRKHFDYYFIFLYSGGPIANNIFDLGFPVFTLNWKNGYSINGRLELLNLLRRIKPDLIHDHDSTPFSRFLFRLAFNCPILSLQHGNFGYVRKGSLQYLGILVDDFFTQLVITNSDFSARMHSKFFFRSAKKIRTIYLGLDLNQYTEAKFIPVSSEFELKRNEEFWHNYKIKITFVGRVRKEKGILELPILAKRLEEIGFPKFEINVVGEGDALEILVQMAKSLDVNHHFIYWGWQQNIKEVFKNSDVFVFPSLWEEPFGLVAIEALLYGLPVVAYNVGGIKEAIGDAPNVLLVPKGNVNSMANAIITLIKLPLLKMKEGQDYIRTKYDIKRTALQLEKVYKEILTP